MQVSNGIARMAKRLPCLAALAVVVMMAPAARATSCLLDIANKDLSATPGPYATVDVAILSGNQVQLTLTAASSTFKVGDVLGFNVSSDVTGLTLLSVSGTGDTTTTSEWNLRPPGNTQVDGFGKFDFSLQGPANERFSQLVFTLQYTGSGVTAEDFGTLDNGFAFAAHIFPQNGNPTGFAACVPEPSSMALLGMGLTMGLGALYRRRRSPAV